MRELDRFRRPVEAHRVRAGHRADAGRRHVARPIVAGALQPRLDRQRRARRRILLHRVMRLVNPRAELAMVREVTARLFNRPLEHVHAQREVRRRQHPDAGSRRYLPHRHVDSLPTRGADHHVDLPLGQLRQVLRYGIRQREVDRDIDAAKVAGGDGALAGMLVDHGCHGGVVRGRQRFHQRAHPTMAEQQYAHQLFTACPAEARAASEGWAKNLSCTRPSAVGKSASRITNVMLRRDAACDSMRIGTSPTDASTCAASAASSCSPSPTTHTIAMFSSRSTCANSDRASTIAGNRHASSIVTDTFTSDDVTTSTGVLKRSNTSNSRRKKPCAISMRVEVMLTTVTPFFDATAVSGRSAFGRSPVISVPRACARCEFRIRTGMLRATAGWMVEGCSTFAPKYASSDASANDRCGTTCGFFTMRGSAVSMPSTSVQIWISPAPGLAPTMAAE